MIFNTYLLEEDELDDELLDELDELLLLLLCDDELLDELDDDELDDEDDELELDDDELDDDDDELELDDDELDEELQKKDKLCQLQALSNGNFKQTNQQRNKQTQYTVDTISLAKHFDSRCLKICHIMWNVKLSHQGTSSKK